MADKEQAGLFNSLGLNVNRQAALAQADARGVGAAQTGRAIGALASGAAKGLFGGGAEGFVKEAGAAHKNEEDRIVAGELGISVESLKARQRLKQNMGQYTSAQTDPIARQMEILGKAVADTQDPDLKQQMVSKIASLRTQAAEFAKLEGQNLDQIVDTQSKLAGIQNITLDGEVVSASVDPTTGIATGAFGERVRGQYSLGDMTKDIGPEGGSDITRMGEILQGPERAQARTAVATARQGLMQYGKVLSNLKDVLATDGDASYLSTAGKATAKIDQVVRNVASFAKSLGFDDTAFLAGVQKSVAEDVIWKTRIPLPSAIQEDSARAQAYRSNIIQLAYLEARSREPANRGLSDSDIELALLAISANSANPQVIIRNLTEKVITNKGNTEMQWDSFPVPEDMGRDRAIRAVVGGAWDKYQGEFEDFKNTFGVREGTFGRSVFNEATPDVDSQPATSVTDNPAPPGVAEDADAARRRRIDALRGN